MSKPSILLLDDDREVLTALEKFLRRRGYNVRATVWPTEAIALLGGTGHHRDVVSSDLRLQAINGFALVRELRESRPEIATIMLSAFTNSQVPKWGIPVNTNALEERYERQRT